MTSVVRVWVHQANGRGNRHPGARRRHLAAGDCGRTEAQSASCGSMPMETRSGPGGTTAAGLLIRGLEHMSDGNIAVTECTDGFEDGLVFISRAPAS